MGRLKYFKSEFNTQGRRGKNMMLRRWAVCDHFVSGAYHCLIVFKFYTQHLGGLVVPFGVYEL